MLAQLLRRMLLGQAALGALVAWLLCGSVVATVIGAMLLPFVTMVLVDTVSMLLSRAAGEPTRMWWRALFGEYLAGFRVFLFRQPWTVQPPMLLPATGGTPQIPVVLVHGYMCNHRIWDDMADALRAQGHPVFAVNLEPVFASIDRYAPIVQAAVDALCAHSSHKKVVLIGHSMGGLAIRAWMRANGTAHVARVITLGTPHVGTQIVRNTHTPNGKQMVWHSRWLEELAAGESDAARALIRIAITPQDNIVFPQRAQLLKGIVPAVFDGLGHVEMCLDPVVIRWTLAEVAGAQTP
ncbi:esterase/lipase family protein [Rhodoferax saidenbachensis]|uniref:AB hydrolase-1 domain-containing protein n=1 Tax=Rhodoferax saidenbachensis TaxID=1484693 RepID=A0A1P8KAK8_9BURK|nr:alpha/beta fold hydrolase [Rhodoferax saidenbachensis]APW43031.1 hypothetical protein RS694_11135 [Rhodoferax saidenbachensis]